MAQASIVAFGDSINHTPTSDVAAGDIVFVGDLVTIAPNPILAGQLGVLLTSGTFILLGIGIWPTGTRLFYEPTPTPSEIPPNPIFPGFVTPENPNGTRSFIGFSAEDMLGETIPVKVTIPSSTATPPPCVPGPLPVTSGLLAHYDAQNAGSLPGGILDGQEVTFWNDISGNAHNSTNTNPAHVSPATVGPTYRASQINGFPALECERGPSPTATVLYVGDVAAFENDDFTIMALIQAKNQPPIKGGAPISLQRLLPSATLSDGSGIGIGAGSGSLMNYEIIGANLQRTAFSEPAIGTGPLALSYDKNGSTVRFFKNGNEITVANNFGIPAVIDFSTTGNKHTVLCGDQGGTLPGNVVPVSGFFGFIGEIIVYDTNLSDSNRIQVEDYILCRWGLIP